MLWEAYVTLLNLIKEDTSFKYISLKEVISLLAEKTNSNLQEVAIYLLNKDIPNELACHIKGTDYKIKETSGKQFSYGMFRAYGKNWAFKYLTNISERHNCTKFDELTDYSVEHWEDWGLAVKNGNVGLLENTYWYRQAFFNLEPIKSLNLLDDDQIKSNQNVIPIWDANYLNLQELEIQSHIELLDSEFLDDLKLIDKTFSFEITTPFSMQEAVKKDIQKENDDAFELTLNLHKANHNIEQLKVKIAELENEKMQFQHNENATLDQEITSENSDLLLTSILLKMLQDEIKIKAHKSQAKILQKIEDSHSHIKGLSKSRTEKLMGKANKLYKQLNNKEMQ